MKLIKLQDKFILVNGEDAKNNELLYNIENNTICRTMGDAEVSHFKIIAGVEFLPKVDFSLLSEADCLRIGFIDIEKLALEAFKQGITFSHKEFSDIAYNRFRTWFSQTKTAQSLNDEKLIGDEQGSLDNFLLNSVLYTQEERELIMDAISNWLQKTEWDVEVEMEPTEQFDEATSIGVFIPKITNNSIKVIRIL